MSYIKFKKILMYLLNLWALQREKQPFSPHLTIGRVRDSRAKKNLRDAFQQVRTEQGCFEAENITFYKSELMPEGPVYTVLKSVKLG